MRPVKQLLLDEINELIDNSCAMIVAKYGQLSPQSSWDLAEDLSKSNTEFKVFKKRLFYKAIEEKNLLIKDKKYEGHIGVAFVKGDPLEATKALVKFQLKNKENLFEIVLGQIEGKLFTSEEINILSTLPGKDEMRAQFLGLLEAPMAQTLSVMESLLTSVIFCLENKTEKDLNK